MTLLRLDPESGHVARVGNYAFNGALPEVAVFDNASGFVAVTVFSRFGQPQAKGAIEFWRVERDPFDPDRVEPVKTRHSIPVTRGAHADHRPMRTQPVCGCGDPRVLRRRRACSR